MTQINNQPPVEDRAEVEQELVIADKGTQETHQEDFVFTENAKQPSRSMLAAISGYISYLSFIVFGRCREDGNAPRYPGKGEIFGVDAFFALRAIGFFVAGIVIAGSAIWFSWHLGSGIRGSLLLGTVAIIVCGLFSVNLMRIAKSGRYFVLELTCIDITVPKRHEGAGEYFNINSQSAFRRNQKVTFATADGRNVTFNFDKTRKFMVGSLYAFYFRKPSIDEEVTLEMLEGLKIDHSIIPQKVNHSDINLMNIHGTYVESDKGGGEEPCIESFSQDDAKLE